MTLALLSKHGSDRVAAVVALLLLSAASSARADVTASKEASAEALFGEGKALMQQGNEGAACPKLAESQRLDPATGTLLMLALCHERTGRTASAWSEYREALARSEQEARADRVELARRHIASLEPHLVRVRLRVAEENASLPSFEVRIDGEKRAPASWTMATPVDPGTHIVEAFSQNERLWSRNVVVETEEQEVLIPSVKPSAPTPAPAPIAKAAPERVLDARASAPPSADERGISALKMAAMGAGTVAVAGAVVGAIFGLRAMSKSDEAHRACPAYPCSDTAKAANDEAKSAAVISNVAFVAAGAGAVGTVSFLLLDGRNSPPSAASASSRPVGFVVGWEGRW